MTDGELLFLFIGLVLGPTVLSGLAFMWDLSIYRDLQRRMKGEKVK